jgi:ubiquinone/menaquinone biosynthesis C-methylase UbiE
LNKDYNKQLHNLYEIFKKKKTKQYDFIKCSLLVDLVKFYNKEIRNPKKFLLKFSLFLANKIEENKNKIRSLEELQKKHKYKKNYHYPVGKHYGILFDNFDKKSLFKEPYQLLKKRFIRNKINIKNFKNKTAIDLGCGNGRYTFALKKLGFKKVVGIDISKKNIYNAKKKKIKNVSFFNGNILKLNFIKEKFDFIFSYGVFHHTPSISKCFKEMHKVMAQNSSGFIFLIGAGGIKWKIINLMRKILSNVSQNYIYKFFKDYGFTNKQIFLILDHVLVPINKLTTPSEIEKIFIKNKFKYFKRCNRGSDFDDIEKIFRAKSIPKNTRFEIFGYGENRFFFKS